MMQAKKAAPKCDGELYMKGSLAPEEDVEAHTSRFPSQMYRSPTILICGHDSRDSRCGILGPLLRKEFNLYVAGLPTDSTPLTGLSVRDGRLVSPLSGTRVGLISHIGGHVFAGNVIIYLPEGFKMASGRVSPLAGMVIWYGRVEPKHVWGIMEETVQHGHIIEELLRGIQNYGAGGQS